MSLTAKDHGAAGDSALRLHCALHVLVAPLGRRQATLDRYSVVLPGNGLGAAAEIVIREVDVPAKSPTGTSHGIDVTRESASDEAPLPALQVAELCDATLADLFRDIEQAAELVTVQVKMRSNELIDAEHMSLARGRELLVSGAVLGLQIRYRLGRTAWCDTLMRTGSSVRLIRVEVDTSG